jgi:hypothetical protein
MSPDGLSAGLELSDLAPVEGDDIDGTAPEQLLKSPQRAGSRSTNPAVMKNVAGTRASPGSAALENDYPRAHRRT